MTDTTALAQEYGHCLADLKQRIQSAQKRATHSVNRELFLLYMCSFSEAWPDLEFAQAVLALWQQAVAKVQDTPWLGPRSLNYGKFGDLLAEVKAVTGGASND